jgi:hypothetical protein
MNPFPPNRQVRTESSQYWLSGGGGYFQVCIVIFLSPSLPPLATPLFSVIVSQLGLSTFYTVQLPQSYAGTGLLSRQASLVEPVEENKNILPKACPSCHHEPCPRFFVGNIHLDEAGAA